MAILETLLEGYLKKEGLEGTFTPLNRFAPERYGQVETLPICLKKQRLIRLASILEIRAGDIEEANFFCGTFNGSQEVSVCQVLAKALLVLVGKLPSLPQGKREYYLGRIKEAYSSSKSIDRDRVSDKEAIAWLVKVATKTLSSKPSECCRKAAMTQVGRPKKGKVSSEPSAA